jgi:hypothetical protein
MSFSSRVQRNEPFLTLLCSASDKQGNQLLKTASQDQIECLCEIAQNILEQNVPLTNREVDNLRNSRKTVYMLADRRLPWTRKRSQLVRHQQQRGGFPPLLALLAPIIGGALGALTNKFVKSKLDK